MMLSSHCGLIVLTDRAGYLFTYSQEMITWMIYRGRTSLEQYFLYIFLTDLVISSTFEENVYGCEINIASF